MNKIIKVLEFNELCEDGEEILMRGIQEIVFYKLDIHPDGYINTYILNDEEFNRKIKRYLK